MAQAAKRPRAIFFGTPQFAVPSLEALLEVADVPLVVTQPDRPAGRRMKLTPPPVKELALQRGIEVIQPRRVRRPALAEQLAALGADVAVVVAYGRILPPALLAAPRLGCVNVHASLLPKLRGAAPIQWAVIGGDAESGVCLMQMDEGMDTGPVLACRSLAIGAEETAGELSERLSKLGGELLGQELPRYLRGELEPRPQDHARATLAPPLAKSHGRVDFSHSARALKNLIRGTAPWPGAYGYLDGRRIKLHRARVLVEAGESGEPGTIVRADRHGIEVACGQGVVAIDELQPEGKKRMTAEQFLAGHRCEAGARFDGGES
ncbi:MAG: methionyl-tRNA formyltransferase [Myxococcales bacterium]|nr:methionyl-tRNA formyltransferase [Myxococcales bacterium]